MKYLLYILLAIMGGFGTTQAQQLVCRGQQPTCAAGNTASCIDMRGAYMPNDPPVPGWHCPEWPMPSSSFGGDQDDSKGKALPDAETDTSKKPCNIEQIVAGWTAKRPALPAFAAARAVAATAKPKGFARAFMQALGVLPGDTTTCTYIPKSDEGKTLLTCTQAAEANGTYQIYLAREIAANTASGMPRNQISGTSARRARERILIECLKTNRMDMSLAEAQRKMSDVTQECKKS